MLFDKQGLFDKKGQVGETLTWAAATIVILLLSFIFLVSVNSLAASKGKFLGIDYFSFEAPGGATQQMLFLILDKYPDANCAGVQGLLDRFAEEGVECDFSAGDCSISTGEGGSGKEITMNGVSLRC